MPYQHRLLDALVRVKLGTQILAQDLSLSFGRRVGFECQALTLAGYRRPLYAQREKQLNEMSTMSKAREYVASGRLVIASDLHETFIPTDDAAVYVKPNGVRDYVEAIALLLDNEGVHQYLTGGPQALDQPGEA